MKTRFIQSVVKTAQTTRTEMPWERGYRREVMIARRKGVVEQRKSA
ncbi:MULTISPECIES: hypothetical protein [unclassified Marinovum]